MKLIVILMFAFFLYPKPNRKVDKCELISALLINEQVKSRFNLTEYENIPIIILDTSGFFSKCTLGQFYGRNVQIVSDTSYLRIRNKPILIINNVKRKRETYIIDVQQKINGAAGFIECKFIHNKAIVTRFNVGYI